MSITTTGLAVEPFDPVMDEWQEEIERRGIGFPEAWPDAGYAYNYWWNDEVGDE